MTQNMSPEFVGLASDDLLRSSILLVEDEPLLSMDVEMTLTSAGYRVVGPAATADDALRLIRDEKLDLAVVDLNLDHKVGFSVPDSLADQQIPFIILSGHSHRMVPERHKKRPYLQKPCVAAHLLRTIRETLNGIKGPT